ncbi:MAG: hypothetical protein LUH02_03440 [Erysipelotrichaceae bacterium]|nr:hypothetical protein [Erysipelotrichaceae bacterium]
MQVIDKENNEIYLIYSGEHIPNVENNLTIEEKDQLERDFKLDGGPNFIPNWSKHYKGNKKNKIEKDNIK